ncbi:hypothetical protein [uncultured Eudoraea sp.]|uniref:hypothetical protein n=1 Tax=uncultured Eudoraea sp. TaxID=1035614 RepID=UPI00261322E5|nr:hypothetical protein [uncultured Eudoraea sp.]
MIKRIPILLMASMAFFVSCSDETTVFVDEQQENLILENDFLKLSGSVNFDNSGVLDIFEDEQITNKQFSTAKADEAGDYPISLVAQVNPPSLGGSTVLTASHVDVEGDYAYVSYNLAGEDYYGAIDIVNVADPHNPVVTSRLIYLNSDINSLEYSDGYLYAVGGLNKEASFTATSSAFVTKIKINAGGTMDIGAGILYGYQPGDNATDIEVDGKEVYVTSGKNGSVTIYDANDFDIKKEELFSDLRSLAFDNNKLALLDAGFGLRILDDNLNTKKEIPISSDFGSFTKRTVDFLDDKIVVAEGSNGVGLYSYDSGTRLQYIPISIDPNKEVTGDVVNNAVAFNKDMIFMANGGAGLSLSEDRGPSAATYGVIQISGSVNYVESKGDYAFAASGAEGLQIIKLNRLSQSLAATCATLTEYEGTSKLVINEGQDIAFRGAKRFNSIQVSGSLLMCGSWTVINDVDIKKESGLLEMNGNLLVGRNRKRKEIKIEEGATLRIEGNLTIYGDLDLKDGSTIEFIGSDSVVNIFGEVKIGDNVTIAGEFDDLQNKF